MRAFLAKAMLVLGLSVVGVTIFATAASAHDASKNKSCAGYSVDATNYPAGSHSTLTVDSHVVADTDFNGTFAANDTWDQTKSHTIHWVVTSGDGLTQYDVDWTATQAACQEATTVPVTTVPVTTVPPTTLPPGDYCQDTRGTVGNQTTVPCTIPTTAPPTPTTTVVVLPTTVVPPTTDAPVPTTVPAIATTVAATPVPQQTSAPTTACVPGQEAPGAAPCIQTLPTTGSSSDKTVSLALVALSLGLIFLLVARGRQAEEA